MRNKLIFLLLLLIVSPLQNPAEVVLSVKARVEISTDKRIYAVREPIKFRAVLITSGDSGSAAFYVSKSFGYAGGNVPEFEIRVRQLSGKPGKGPGGAWVGDALRPAPGRTAEQILKEDFVLLRPGSLIGFEQTYGGCEIQTAGKRPG